MPMEVYREILLTSAQPSLAQSSWRLSCTKFGLLFGRSVIRLVGCHIFAQTLLQPILSKLLTMLGQARPNKVRLDQSRPVQARPDQARPGHTSPVLVTPVATWQKHARPKQARPSQARPDQTSLCQIKQDKTRPSQTRPDRVRLYLADSDLLSHGNF